MTIQEGTYFILNKLRGIYDDREASQITDWVMEHITGSAKAERMVYKNDPLSATEETQVKDYTARLLKHEPVQYILQEAWFFGLRFFVNEHVLIPRPETEELVEWVVTDCKFPVDTLSILDIGTGSGCIPVALKRRIRKATVAACDISEDALAVARRNAETLGADVDFIQLNFLDADSAAQLPVVDIIISNPPYIPEKDKEQMKPNVLQYEPATALFVPDNDPLVFYNAIAIFGKSHLRPGGQVYLEIHEDLGQAVLQVFAENGYTAALKKDMQGKDRMIRARLAG